MYCYLTTDEIGHYTKHKEIDNRWHFPPTAANKEGEWREPRVASVLSIPTDLHFRTLVSAAVGGTHHRTRRRPKCELPDDDDGLQATLATKPSSIVNRWRMRILGESHSNHWRWGISDLGDANHWNNTTLCLSYVWWLHLRLWLIQTMFDVRAFQGCRSLIHFNIQHSIFYHPINSSLHIITSLAEESRRPRPSHVGIRNFHQNQASSTEHQFHQRTSYRRK